MGREVRGGRHDRSLWCLRYDVVVDVHLHEGRVEGFADLSSCDGVQVLCARVMLVGMIAMRAGATSCGERSLLRARLRSCLLAFIEFLRIFTCRLCSPMRS